MRKLPSAAACLAAAVFTIAQSPSWAAPSSGHNTEDLVVTCVDATVRVITNPGASAWEVDAQREPTGVRYFATSIDGRFYEGELTQEPTGVYPVFAFAKEWGNRTGHGDTLSCLVVQTFTDELGTFTGFLHVTVTRQDKGN